jgi:hypothetical protein
MRPVAVAAKYGSQFTLSRETMFGSEVDSDLTDNSATKARRNGNAIASNGHAAIILFFLVPFV